MFSLKVDSEIELRLHDLYGYEDYYYLIDRNRNHLKPFMDWVDHYSSPDDIRHYILGARKPFASGETIATVIFYQGKVAGSISLMRREFNSGEIGYWLGEEFTGKGIVTRATRALVNYAFNSLGMHKLIIRAVSHNQPSLAIPKRLGFAYQGRDIKGRFLYGQYYDFDVYYLLNEDWHETDAPYFRFDVGDGIELRPFEIRHASEYFRVIDRNRAYFKRWLPWLDFHTSIDDTILFIKSTQEKYAKYDGLNCAIWVDQEHCGQVSYHYWDTATAKTEIGYYLSQSHTGRGIMSRAVSALIDYAFDVLNMRRIEMPCAVDNVNSCAIPKRLGFTEEGIIRSAEWLYDHYVDWRMFSLLRPEWKQ